MADRSVTQICEDMLTHPDMLSGCNLFVQGVCGALGYGEVFSKGDNADTMIGKFASAPCHVIGKDPDAATAWANKGMLVLGGLTMLGLSYTNKLGKQVTASMGHVVVVVPGGPSLPRKIMLSDKSTQSCRGGFPLCYGGAANARYRIRSRLSVDAVFPSPVLREVTYAYLDLPRLN